MTKLTYKKYLLNSLNKETPILQSLYNSFVPLNIEGSALICESQCIMSIQENEINGLKINNNNGIISISSLDDNNITVNGNVQSDLNSDSNDEVYKFYKIIYLPIPWLTINNTHADTEMHIIFKEETSNENPKFQINIILLNQTLQEPTDVQSLQTYKLYEGYCK